MNNDEQKAMLLAENAKAVLSNDAYKAAWSQMHDALMNNLLSCEDTDDKGRYNAWQAVRIARNLNAALSDIIVTGEATKVVLERQSARNEKISEARIRVV